MSAPRGWRGAPASASDSRPSSSARVLAPAVVCAAVLGLLPVAQETAFAQNVPDKPKGFTVSPWFEGSYGEGPIERQTIGGFIDGDGPGLRLDWTVPPGSDITEYDYEWRVKDGAFPFVGGGGGRWTPEPPATISGLTPEQEYEVRLRAENAHGWSAWTDWVAATTPPNLPTVAVPTVTAVAATELSLSWTSPGGVGIYRPIEYHVRYKPTGSWVGLWRLDRGYPATATTATLTGLEADTEYEVQVRAVWTAGGGHWSPLATARTIATDGAALTVVDATFDEDAGQTHMTVNLSEAIDAAHTVDWTVNSDGTDSAAHPDDFQFYGTGNSPATSGTLSFAAGQTSAQLRVDIIDDVEDEDVETFTVTLSNPSHASIGRLTGTGTITDNDMPGLSVDDVTVAEDAGSVDVTVRVVPESTCTVPYPHDVDWALAGVTATEGTDFEGPGGKTSGSIRFAGCQKEETVTVAITDDMVAEPDETFTLTLSNPSDLELTKAVGTVTIEDTGAPTAPSIASIAITSDPDGSGLDDNTYCRDCAGTMTNEILVTVTFTESVTVSGDPFLTLDFDGVAKQAGYLSVASSGAVVGFSYSILAGDVDEDGIAIAANSLKLNGGTIRNEADTVDAELAHNALPADAGHKVDGVRPTLESRVVDLGEDPAALVITFSEPLRTNQSLTLASFLFVPTNSVTAVEIDGSVLTATLGTAVAEGGSLTLALAPSIKDQAGNLAEGVTGAVTITPASSTQQSTEPLGASFVGMPQSHDGATAFSFRIEFTEDIDADADDMRDHALAVTGGSVTAAAKVDGRDDLWEFTVEPSGAVTVSIQLEAGRACAVAGAICTSDGRQLSVGLARTVVAVSASGAQALESLTAEFVDMPVEHDGQSAFSFRVAFSEDVGVTLAVFRDESLAVTGGEATQAKRVGGRRDLYEVTVQPDSRDDVTVTLAAGAACGTTGAVCTRGSENQRPLSNSPSAAVSGPPDEPLTASFSGVPAEHEGPGTTFTFGLTFSEEFDLSYRTLRDEALEASGGTVRRAKRQQSGSNQSWTIHVEPDGDGAVTVRLPAGSVETGDGRALSNSSSATVAGPVGISVADARVEEDAGAVLAFTVALSRAASSTLTVDYTTSDGSAQAGVDYTAASGTLTFQSGESSKTIEVAVLDDAHDEGEETLTLTLSNASSGRITNANATGTIENRDPLPRALLARFGRTAAVHVVEHVEERLQAPREPGVEGRFAGRQLRRGMEREMAQGFLRQLGGAAGMHPAGMNAAAMGSHGAMAGAGGGGMSSLHASGVGGGLGMAAVAAPMGGSPGLGMAAGSLGGPGLGMGDGSPGGAMAMGPMAGAAGGGGGGFGGGLFSMGLGGGDLLTGSEFALNRESRGGILSFWSRGARSHFSGREGTLGLNGDVRTTMLGTDYARGPLVAGLSLSHSRGLGEYAGVAAGQVLSSVTGLYPWLGYKVTDRVTVWGVGGYGAGGMLLTPDTGPALESGLSMAMAAAGTRGELLAGGASGFELAFKADALWVGTAVDGVDGPAGRLKATDAAVTRFRTGLEGSRAYTLGGRLSLTPSIELGLRHDGGDAETGAGMDVGVGLVLSDAASGLSVDVRVRTLLVHQDENFSERGVALSLSYNPTPSTPLGFTAKVAPSWGGQATSGAEALWGRETMAGMAQGGIAQGSRFDGEVGYGLPVGNRFVGTPRIGFSTSEYGRDYRIGYGLGVLDGESLNFELGVDAQRRESPLLGGADNGVLARASLDW